METRDKVILLVLSLILGVLFVVNLVMLILKQIGFETFDEVFKALGA